MAFRRSGNGDAASIPDQRQYRFGTADQFDQVLIHRAPAYDGSISAAAPPRWRHYS
jgi:hypothetical protein